MTTTPLPQSRGWVIYGKQGCPLCERVVELLTKSNEPYMYHCRDRMGLERFQVHEELKEYIRGYPARFPLVFLNGKFIGGFIELSNLLQRKQN